MAKRRIRVRDVKAAYKKTGFIPQQNLTLDENADGVIYACPIGALSPEHKHHDATEIFKWANHQYGRDYVNGFVKGFDNGFIYIDVTENCALGRRDGVTVRKSIFKESV